MGSSHDDSSSPNSRKESRKVARERKKENDKAKEAQVFASANKRTSLNINVEAPPKAITTPKSSNSLSTPKSVKSILRSKDSPARSSVKLSVSIHEDKNQTLVYQLEPNRKITRPVTRASIPRPPDSKPPQPFIPSTLLNSGIFPAGSNYQVFPQEIVRLIGSTLAKFQTPNTQELEKRVLVRARTLEASGRRLTYLDKLKLYIDEANNLPAIKPSEKKESSSSKFFKCSTPEASKESNFSKLVNWITPKTSKVVPVDNETALDVQVLKLISKLDVSKVSEDVSKVSKEKPNDNLNKFQRDLNNLLNPKNNNRKVAFGK